MEQNINIPTTIQVNQRQVLDAPTAGEDQ